MRYYFIIISFVFYHNRNCIACKNYRNGFELFIISFTHWNIVPCLMKPIFLITKPKTHASFTDTLAFHRNFNTISFSLRSTLEFTKYTREHKNVPSLGDYLSILFTEIFHVFETVYIHCHRKSRFNRAYKYTGNAAEWTELREETNRLYPIIVNVCH